MSKLKKIFTNVRLLLLIFVLIISVIAINPAIDSKGLAIRSITKDSAAAHAQPAFDTVNPDVQPRSRERILQVFQQPVNTVEEFYKIVNEFDVNQTFTVYTSRGKFYKLTVEPLIEVIELNETITRNITEEVFNESTNTTENVTTQVTEKKKIEKVIGKEDVGFNLYPAPSNNIRKGLDLTGGTRVLLKPEREVPTQELDIIISNIQQRLNVFGLSDITVRPVKDFERNTFIAVEIAGANKQDVRELISRQGKFESKISNNTIFRGGDIKNVCLSASCSGLDLREGCSKSADEWFCRFFFSITLSAEAAKKQADATRNLEVITESGREYLSQDLELYLDDELVDVLKIGAELKGSAVTDIQISGSGRGTTEAGAKIDALNQMKKLQSILQTGSLPVKIEIVKEESLSPVLGQEFIKSALMIAMVAIIAVGLVVFIRYRKWQVSVPIVFIMLCEAVITLGFAAIVRWNIDLSAIAGIIIAIGTGVDDQIVITDETLRGAVESMSWKDKIKRAFGIVVAAYFTVVVAMIPLYFAGAGMLKGFAIITIVGVTIGVLITRPAFGTLLQIFIEKK